MNDWLLEAYIKEILLDELKQDEDPTKTTGVTKWVKQTFDSEFDGAAKKLGVSKSHLYKIARGDTVPSMQLAMKIKDAGASISSIERLAKKRSKKKKRYSGKHH